MAATITEHEAEQVKKANATGKQPVVFVHGLWLLPSSWDRWTTVFKRAGYTTLTPGWPDDPETVAEAKEHPEVFAKKSIGQIADHFDEVIQGLDKKPAIIGHSFGGLLTQILAGRGLSAASVAFDSAPFRGILPLPYLVAEIGETGAREPGQPRSRGAAHLRPVPLLVRQHLQRGGGEAALQRILGAGVGRAALPGRERQPQPLDARPRSTTKTPTAGRC